jgi:hypothetical protein
MWVNQSSTGDFIAQNAMGQRFSLRKPTTLQEQSGKKKRRLAPFEMTVVGAVG